MEFKDFVEKYKPEVYRKICEYVQIKEPEAHYKIMRDYIDRQGKYRRPGLLLLTAHMYGAKLSDAILPAAAQQLSEDWILMQDDCEDDSDLRRGKPAAQKLYGWELSVNATNTGQMAMWKMLKDYIIQVGPEKGNRLYEKFYDMLQYTVEGQYIETNFIHVTKDLNKASEEMYYRIIDSKASFYTVYGPMQLGAIVGNATESDLEMVKEIGWTVARAFQIVDDILDMTADEKLFGKKLYGDVYEGKITLMVLHAHKNATPEERDKIDVIFAKKRQDKTEAEIMYIMALIRKYKSIEYARGLADQYGNAAIALYEKYKDKLPNNEYRPIFLSAVQEMFIRNK